MLQDPLSSISNVSNHHHNESSVFGLFFHVLAQLITLSYIGPGRLVGNTFSHLEIEIGLSDSVVYLNSNFNVNYPRN